MRGHLPCFQPKLGHWCIKSHGTALGIVCHWPSPFPTPTIPFTLPYLYGTASFRPAIPFGLSPPRLNGEVLFQRTLVPALALRETGSSYRQSFPWFFFLFLQRVERLPSPPPNLPDILFGRLLGRTSSLRRLLTKGILTHLAQDCMTLTTSPFRRTWFAGLIPLPRPTNQPWPHRPNVILFHNGFPRQVRTCTSKVWRC